MNTLGVDHNTIYFEVWGPVTTALKAPGLSDSVGLLGHVYNLQFNAFRTRLSDLDLRFSQEQL